MAGASSPAVRAQPTSLVFRVAKDGSVSPASISIDAFRQNTTDAVSWSTSPVITGLNGTTWFDRTNYFETVPTPALPSALTVVTSSPARIASTARGPFGVATATLMSTKLE